MINRALTAAVLVLAALLVLGQCNKVHAQPPTVQVTTDRVNRPMPVTVPPAMQQAVRAQAGPVAHGGTTPVPNTPPLPPVSTLAGYVDQKFPTIAGWALNTASPQDEVGFYIYSEINNRMKFIGFTTATWERTDLTQMGWVGNHAGWGINTPASICNGLDHTIHVYAFILNDSIELPHSDSVGLSATKPMRCGTPKPSGTVEVRLTDDFAESLSTLGHNAYVVLNQIMESGQAIPIARSDEEGGIPADGRLTFRFDSDGEPLPAGQRYELEASASDHLVARKEFVLVTGTNSFELMALKAPLAIFPNGNPPNIQPVNGWMMTPALVCNRSFGDSSFQASIVLSGPGQYKPWIEQFFLSGGDVPPVGWCWQYTFSVPVDTNLPNGKERFERINIGPWNAESFSDMFVSAFKGVRQSIAFPVPKG